MEKRWIIVLLLLGALSLTACKGDGKKVPVLDYELTSNSIIIYPIDGAEYRLNGGDWQDNNVFDKLQEGGEYTIEMRMKNNRAGDIVSENVKLPYSNDIDVYLIGGQSNALGISPIRELSWEMNSKSYKEIRIYAAGQNTKNPTATGQQLNNNADEWTIVKTGLGVNSASFGPEIGMAEVLQPFYPLKENKAQAAIIKYTWGGTELWNRWLPPSSYEQGIGERAIFTRIDDKRAGDLYCNFVYTARARLDDLRSEGFNPIIKGMVWMQGEGDATNLTKTQYYGKNLENLINDIRSEFQTDDMPFVVGEIRSLIPSFRDDLRAIQAAIAKEIPNVHFVSTMDLSVGLLDWWHFDAPSMLSLGQRFASVLIGASSHTPITGAAEEMHKKY